MLIYKIVAYFGIGVLNSCGMRYPIGAKPSNDIALFKSVVLWPCALNPRIVAYIVRNVS